MAATKIGDVVSLLRNLTKSNKQDSFLTDFELYTLFKKNAAVSMRRLDDRGRLTKFSSVFETLDYVELEEVDKIEGTAWGIKSLALMRRTKLEMPMFTEGAYGPMVNSITSLDASVVFKMVRNVDIYNMISKDKNAKYNNWKYTWFLNDRLYFYNIDYPAVRIEGLFEEDISAFKSNYSDKCKRRQDQSINVPDAILQECVAGVLKDLGLQLQTPSDVQNNNQSPLK